MNCKIHVTSVVGGETVSPTDRKLSPARKNAGIQPLHKGYRLWIKTKRSRRTHEKSYAPFGQEVNLTDYTWTEKGVTYKVLEHKGGRYKVLMLNKKAVSK